MKIVIISDTHGHHEKLGTLSGDVLIHCGDFENLFAQTNAAIDQMDAWFGQQDFDQILCIGGNHDRLLEDRVTKVAQPFANAVYLQDSGFVHKGVKFYGVPWVPQLIQHAFYADDAALHAAWAGIPADTDVLITHTPPAGILDVSSRGLTLGCAHLARRVRQVKPALHCFGHVHASAGHLVKRGVTFVNASSINSAFEIANAPFEFEFKRKKRR